MVSMCHLKCVVLFGVHVSPKMCEPHVVHVSPKMCGTLWCPCAIVLMCFRRIIQLSCYYFHKKIKMDKDADVIFYGRGDSPLLRESHR